jgi:AcrR family transcriptional regulator
MAEMPTERISARCVAERAGYDPALVGYYFGNKAGLFEAVLEAATAEVASHVERAQQESGSLEESLRVVLHDALRLLGEMPDLPTLIAQQLLLRDEQSDKLWDAAAVPYLRSIEELIEEGIRAGTFRPIEPRTFAYTVVGIPLLLNLMTPMYRRAFGDDPVSPDRWETVATQLADVLTHGMLASQSNTQVKGQGRRGNPRR